MSDEDIEAERQKMLEPLGDNAAQLRAMFESDQGVATIRRNLLTDKTLERLQAIAAQEPAEESE